MMQEKLCYYCRRKDREVEILDCILDDEPIQLCERCAVTSRAVIIRKPTEQQLASINKSYSVYDRLRKAAGLEPLKKPTEEMFRNKVKEIKPEEIRPRVWRTIEEKKEIRAERIAEKFAEQGLQEEAQETQTQAQIPTQKAHLVSNFAETVRKARENKKLGQKELAELIAEPEQEIKEVERGKVPENEKIIRKLEQFLRINLLKEENKEVDLRSKSLTLGELKKIKEAMFGRKEEKEAPIKDDIEVIGIEEDF